MLTDDIEYFLAVAATGTLTTTADRLGISQPALSKSIQRLERKVGVRLIARGPRGVELTEAGRAFHDRLQAVSRNMDDAVQEARNIGGGQAGLLRLGVTPATSDFALRALFPTLLDERPAAHVSLSTAFSGPLLEEVARRGVELAVCPIPEKTDPVLTFESLYADPCCLIMRAGHPLAARKTIAIEDLAGQSWAGTRKHEFTRSQLEHAFRRRGLRLGSVIVEADSLGALVAVVSRTSLISMINVRSVREGGLTESVVVRPLAFDDLERRIGIVRRTGYLSPIAERACEILRDAARAGEPPAGKPSGASRP